MKGGIIPISIHKPSGGGEGPTCCLLCSVIITENNKNDSCPKSPDYIRPIPKSIFDGDLSITIGERMRAIRAEEDALMKGNATSFGGTPHNMFYAPVDGCNCELCDDMRKLSVDDIG